MPTPEEIGTRWVHPKGQVRYYVQNFREITGIDAPKQVKVWMDRFGEVHVPYCDDKDMEIQIIRAMDKYMRGDRKVVCSYTCNCERMFTIIPNGSGKHNVMSYDNIESAKKRILALRKAGYHIYGLNRIVVKGCETYNVYMDTSTYHDGKFTAGYQEVDIDDSVIYLTYHGEDDIRRDVSNTYNYEGEDAVEVRAGGSRGSVRPSELHYAVQDISKMEGIETPYFEYMVEKGKKIVIVDDEPSEDNCSRIQQGYQEVFIPYPWVPHHIGMKFHGEIYD